MSPARQGYGTQHYFPSSPSTPNPSANRYNSLPPEPTGPIMPPEVSTSSTSTVSYAQQQSGVPVTDGMKKAYEECKASVLRIAAQCRAKNRKFRDIKFDIENDPNRCLHNLSDSNIFPGTADARRIPEIFENPVFYRAGSSVGFVQGAVEDCYLVSALSTMTFMDHLIHTFGKHDEEVGVYGFIFYRDYYWIPVIIDDLLFTRIPKYEQLTFAEKELYHFEKEQYNEKARRGAETLYFARPANGSQETWVPLVEKAYAKLHGDYASLMFGRTCDAIEDMTGGVSYLILTSDILDKDKFWNEELVKANKDRLFGCWFKTTLGIRSSLKSTSVDGLVGNLSHSIAKAVEIKGKRFVVIRDPWGDAGWDGPWSDGSKEWTKEWLEVLPELGHSFGLKGQFVMEYKDFLKVWQEIQRTLIFDNSWIMSSQWLHVSQPFPCMDAFSFGDITFTFSLAKASPAIITFSRYDIRYFRDIQGPCIWNLDFIVAKEGEIELLAESSYSFFYTRSVSVEIDLEAGNYVVLGRLDPVPARDKSYFTKGLDSGWDRRKLAHIMSERAKGQSIAANYMPNPQLLPTQVSDILSGDTAKADKATIDTIRTHSGGVNPGESVTVTTKTTTKTTVQKNGAFTNNPLDLPSKYHPYNNNINNISAGPGVPLPYYSYPDSGWDRAPLPVSSPPTPHIGSPPPPGPFPKPLPIVIPPAPPRIPSPLPVRILAPPLMMDTLEDDNSIVVGLKVYTKRNAPTTICGRVIDSRQSKQVAGIVRY